MKETDIVWVGVGRRVMNNYTPEVIWDDYVEGCACCALNYGLEDDDE